MRVLIIAGHTRSLINFRGDLIKDMVKRGHEVVTVGPEAGYENEITELGARFIKLTLERTGTNLFKDMAFVTKLLKIVKFEDPDIVFTYTIKSVIYGSIAARIAGVKNIFSMVTGLGYVFVANDAKAILIRIISIALYSIAFKCCHKVFFQNPDDLRDFINRGLVKAEDCVLVDGSGINLERFKPAPLPDAPVFLMICRIIRDKGVLEYLSAAHEVKRIFPQSRFQLLGPFDINPNSLSYKDLKPYIEDGSVEYLGEINDVRPYIAECSVYVLPSYREGTPRTVLEAMAMGRPVITSDAPGCRETLIDGKTGFFVPVKDVDKLIEKIIYFIKNPKEREMMGHAGLEYCRQRYDVNKVNNIMLTNMRLL